MYEDSIDYGSHEYERALGRQAIADLRAEAATNLIADTRAALAAAGYPSDIPDELLERCNADEVRAWIARNYPDFVDPPDTPDPDDIEAEHDRKTLEAWKANIADLRTNMSRRGIDLTGVTDEDLCDKRILDALERHRTFRGVPPAIEQANGTDHPPMLFGIEEPPPSGFWSSVFRSFRRG
jgi:hypothetical protein